MKKEGEEQKNQKPEKRNDGTRLVMFLSFVSFVGFGLIFVSSFFDIDLSLYADSSLLVALGIFLASEGEIFSWGKYLKGRISQTEILHIVVGLLGITSIILGIGGIFMNVESGFEGVNRGFIGMKGIISLIAMIMILFQSFLIRKKN